jgi:hypothetical protein
MQKNLNPRVTGRESRIQRTKVSPMMKMIFLPMMLFSLVEGGAQHANLRLKAVENEVPKSVVGSFRGEYGKTVNATWTIISSSSLLSEFGIRENKKGEKSTYYGVSFSESDGNKEVVYDHFGHSVGVKKPIATTSLPSPITNCVQRAMEHAEIISAEAISEDTSAPTQYKLVISQQGALQSVFVRASGELVKTN